MNPPVDSRLVSVLVPGKVEVDPLDQRLCAPVGLVELGHLQTLKEREKGRHARIKRVKVKGKTVRG